MRVWVRKAVEWRVVEQKPVDRKVHLSRRDSGILFPER